MYGADAYGTVPYGDTGFSLEDILDVNAMLSESGADLVYTVEVSVRNIATDVETVLRLASCQWATEPDDVPGSAPFEDRLNTVLDFGRSVIGDRVGVNFTSGEGQIAWANTDGAYDDYVDEYAVDGRAVVARLGRKTDALKNHLVIFRGVAIDWEAGDEEVTLTVRDRGAQLDVPAQPNAYAGTGGYEGGQDLAGKRRPITHGSLIGVVPVLVDAALLIYQVSDGPIYDVAAVYDRGVTIGSSGGDYYDDYASLAAATTAPGRIDRATSLGLFRLGAAPSGEIRAAVFDAEDGDSTTTTSAVVLDFLSRVGVQDADIDGASLDALTIRQPSPIHHFVGPDDALSCRQVVDRLMAGIGGWIGHNRQGKLAAGVFDAPSGAPVASFDAHEGEVIDFKRVRLPDGVWPPPWQWRVAFARFWKPVTDFAGAITDYRRAYFSEPYRLKTASDGSIRDDHELSKDPGIVEAFFGSNLASFSGANEEAQRLLALFASGYRLFQVTVDRRGLQCDLGSVIRVRHPRHGFANGRLLRVCAIKDSIVLNGPDVDKVELTGFG